jgi:hypothetical protein
VRALDRESTAEEEWPPFRAAGYDWKASPSERLGAW